MARLGQNYSSIALNGFDHSLRTRESKERFENEVDISKMNILEQEAYFKKVSETEKAEKAAKAKAEEAKRNSRITFGNNDIEIATINRVKIAADLLAKGKKSR